MMGVPTQEMLIINTGIYFSKTWISVVTTLSGLLMENMEIETNMSLLYILKTNISIKRCYLPGQLSEFVSFK